MPCSTASRIDPPCVSTFNASSLDGFPNGQVDTIKGTSPCLTSASAARVFRSVDALSKPTAVPLTNRLRDIVIRSKRRMFDRNLEVKMQKLIFLRLRFRSLAEQSRSDADN